MNKSINLLIPSEYFNGKKDIFYIRRKQEFCMGQTDFLNVFNYKYIFL